MASLTQLLASHRRILVLDAASTRVQVGLLQPGDSSWRATDEEAGQAVFAGADALLRQAGAGLDEVDAFVFCEGPGSMLGTRTVAMALRTWKTLRARPSYAYQSLAIAAAGDYARAARPFTVIADARRDSWHCQPVATDGSLGDLQRLPTGELPAGEILTPAHFRAWATLPARASVCSYNLEQLLPAMSARDLFRLVEAPDAHQHDAPDYKRWSAQVHSAETAARP
jgi:tRNA threonylcarbamoyladenosine biosynthesis protein TsaB